MSTKNLDEIGIHILKPSFERFFNVDHSNIEIKEGRRGEIFGETISHIFLVGKGFILKLKCHYDKKELFVMKDLKKKSINTETEIDDSVVDELLNITCGLLRRHLKEGQDQVSQSLPFRTSGIFQLYGYEEYEKADYTFWTLKWASHSVTYECEISSRDCVVFNWDSEETEMEFL